MSDGFEVWIVRSKTFLADLARNNERTWFDAHKQVFKNEIEAPAKLFTQLFADDLSRLTGQGHEGKMGRIYRDVRFSKDKNPYNTYLHCYWQGGGQPGPGWLLNVQAEGAELMTGLHALDADGVRLYRTAVDRDGDKLAAAIESLSSEGMQIMSFGDDMLKRVPKPYTAYHPHADLLKRKQIIIGRQLTEADMSNGLIPAMTAAASELLPFWEWCGRAMRPGT
ncbi:MAG: DUF2461 domain-containing protein [Anaerolineae bacterium]